MEKDAAPLACNPLVDILIDKVSIATAVVIVKCAKKEGISAVLYARNFRVKYIFENQNKINPNLEQSVLTECQDEVLNKLRKALPAPVSQPNTRQGTMSLLESEDDVLVDGGSPDWFGIKCSATGTRQETLTNNVTKSRIRNAEDTALQNLQFVESIMRLREESERNSTVPADLLQALLYDTEECTRPRHCRSTLMNVNNKQDSADSGIFSEGFSDSNSYSGVKFVSNSVVKFALQSSNSNRLVFQSVRLIVEYVNNEIKTKPVQVFCNWKGSLVEYACDILVDCSRNSVENREIVLNFIYDLLEGVWRDVSLCQHQQWEMKMFFVRELLTDAEVCYDVLQYISEKVDYFLKCFINKNPGVPLMAEKLNLWLNLYCSVCEAVDTFKSKSLQSGDVSHMNSVEEDVTRLWQEKWCPKDKEGNDEEQRTMVESCQIPVLERFTICVNQRYPLLALLAMEAMNRAKNLICEYNPFS